MAKPPHGLRNIPVDDQDLLDFAQVVGGLEAELVDIDPSSGPFDFSGGPTARTFLLTLPQRRRREVKVDRDEVLIDKDTPAPTNAEALAYIREWAENPATLKRFPGIERHMRRLLLGILLYDINILLTKRKTPAVNRRKSMHHGRVTQPFEAPAPATETALSELATQHEEIVQTTETLERAGVDPTEFQMNALRDVSERYGELARNLGLHAIAEGRMTQATMARAYGVRPATVNNWVNEARNKNKEQ